MVCKQNAEGVEEIFEPRQLMGNESKALDERKQYIDIVLKYIDNSTWDFIYEQIKREYGGVRRVPSRRTIERYWQIYKQAQSLNCLAPKFSQRGVHRALRLDPHIQDIVLNVLRSSTATARVSVLRILSIPLTVNAMQSPQSLILI